MEKAKRRKISVSVLATIILASVHTVDAQQPAKVPRIAYLSSRSPSSAVDPFLQGLGDLGYRDGHNIVIEYRYADGKESRLLELAAELARLKVDVIVAASTAAAVAVQKVTKTIPIVLTDSADPVAAGLVLSLAQPGGNITGSTFMAPELATKQLELLKEIIPRLSRVAVLANNPASGTSSGHIPKLRATAPSLGVELEIATVNDASEFEKVFSELVRKHATAVHVISHPFFSQNRQRLVDVAAKVRMPVMYPQSNYVRVGGLVSYGTDHSHLVRRAAYFVGKILKGAKPADLLIEQPTKSELVINLKTAKDLGLTIPDEVLRWADEIIK
jgi:putative tryptophan/tyrosine transport system substrate-binding protein